jgi:hypothetical protein
MEDWLHFICVFAPYIFRGVLSPLVQRMWECITFAVRHYFRAVSYSTREDFTQQARAARDRLFEFAQLAEQNDFPPDTFSVNLHILICRCAPV